MMLLSMVVRYSFPAGMTDPSGMVMTLEFEACPVGATVSGGSGGASLIGMSVIPHLGHLPGVSERTSLCSGIGHV
jgi:hypothetical protein